MAKVKSSAPSVATKPAAAPKPAASKSQKTEPVYRELSPVSAVPVAEKTVSRDDIARRAYELFEQGHPGGEMDHWHEAERQLRE